MLPLILVWRNRESKQRPGWFAVGAVVGGFRVHRYARGLRFYPGLATKDVSCAAVLYVHTFR